jgi:hypothetical protein
VLLFHRTQAADAAADDDPELERVEPGAGPVPSAKPASCMACTLAAIAYCAYRSARLASLRSM